MIPDNPRHPRSNAFDLRAEIFNAETRRRGGARKTRIASSTAKAVWVFKSRVWLVFLCVSAPLRLRVRILILCLAADRYLNEEEFSKGKLESKIEGKVEMARNLLRSGVAVDLIMQASGLSRDQIEKISNNSKA